MVAAATAVISQAFPAVAARKKTTPSRRNAVVVDPTVVLQQAGIPILPQAIPSDDVIDDVTASARLESDNEASYITG